MLKNLVFSLIVLCCLACAPGFVPDPNAIEARWAKTRGSQPSHLPYISRLSKSSRVNRITGQLARAAGIRGLKVYVQESPDWNASMQSFQKKMIVNRGLLDQTPSDDEVAAVIGHELGHYVFHHSKDILQAHNSNQQLIKMFHDNSSTAEKARERAEVAVLLNEILVNKPASRNAEREADSFGIMIMKKAGYDPSAAIRVWWKQFHKAKRMGVRNNLLATHPMGDERIVNLMRTVAAFNKDK